MSTTLVKQLVEAGVHFGHRASRWNPKMRPYIYARRNLIHIIDVRETIRGLLRARKYLPQVASQRQPGAVRGHQAAGRRDACRSAGRALRHALRQRPLAGRHADQFPHDSQPAWPPGRAGDDSRRATRSTTYSKKMQSALNREYRKMYPQPQRHPHDEPPARVPGGGRPQEGEERGPRSPQAGHHHRGLDRHRLRSGRGRPADSRQRRQHPLDRVDRQYCWPTRSAPARVAGGQRSNSSRPRAPSRLHGRGLTDASVRRPWRGSTHTSEASTTGLGDIVHDIHSDEQENLRWQKSPQQWSSSCATRRSCR